MTIAATLLVDRAESHWLDRRFGCRLLIDGRVRGVVGHGGELALVVAPGRHTARARVGWTGSGEVPFSVAPGATVRMRVRPRGNPLSAVWFLLSAGKYLRLTPSGSTGRGHDRCGRPVLSVVPPHGSGADRPVHAAADVAKP